MAERIYKGTAEINGVRKPVTYKIVNAPESRADDLLTLAQNHSSHKDIQLQLVYDSDQPALYENVQALAREPVVPARLMSTIQPPAQQVAPVNPNNPGNVPPKEASLPPENAPTGDAAPHTVPTQPDTARANKSR